MIMTKYKMAILYWDHDYLRTK